MLTSGRDAGRATARFDDIVDEARKGRDTADEEGSYGTPVGSPSLRVAVDTVKVVHVRDGHFAATEDVVAGDGIRGQSTYRTVR